MCVPFDFGVDEVRCLNALSNNGVEFLVVGGYAVRHYGHSRPAKDLDVLVGNDPANSIRLVAALTELIGMSHPNITPDQFTGRKRQVNFESWGLRFEVLSAADGIDFSQAYARRSTVAAGTIEVPVISKSDLILMKQNAGRPQDVSDVAALQSG